MSTSTTAQRKPARSDVLSSSAYFGAAAAALGATFFAGYATLKGRPVILWTVTSGAQWFVLGSTFWFSRTLLRNTASQPYSLSRQEELGYTSLAGAIAGMTGGALRGRANIVPGAIVFGLMGLAGQASSPAFMRMADTPSESRPILDRLSESKWWPLKSLSDADYEEELSEKVIGVEAEMAIIDEKIAILKQQHAKSDG